MEKLLEQYHPILLSKEDVKAIFRLGSDRSLRNLKKEYSLRKRGRHYLTVDVKRAIKVMQSEAQAA
jgi:hypothetical protein